METYNVPQNGSASHPVLSFLFVLDLLEVLCLLGLLEALGLLEVLCFF